MAFLYAQQRQHSRQISDLQKEWSLERGALLTRIQAPAEASFLVGPEELSQNVPFEDDEAFQEMREQAEKVLEDAQYREEII